MVFGTNKAERKMAVGFILGIALCLGFFILLQTIFISKKVSQSVTQLYIDMCAQIIEARSCEIANWNENNLNDLRIFTDNPVIKTGDMEQILTWLDQNRALRNTAFGNTFFCGKDGNTFQLGKESSTYVADREYFRRIMREGANTYIGEPVTSRALNRTVFIIARAARNSAGEVIGFAGASVFPDMIREVASDIKVGEEGKAFIISHDGTLVAHWDEQKVLKQNYLLDAEKNTSGLRDLAMHIAKKESGYGYYKEGREERLVLYTPIDGTSWSLCLEIPKEQIQRTNRLATSIIAGMNAFMFVIVLIFSMLFISRTVKPLRIVEETIIGIAQGDADLTKRITDINRKDEIGRLVGGFNHFVEKLHEIMSHIKESKNVLATIETDLKNSVENTGCSITEILCNIESASTMITDQASTVEETAGAVRQIAQNINALEKLIQTQAAGVSEASAAVEQMVGNINSVDNTIAKMSNEFMLLQNDAKDGIEKQEQVNETIRTIASQSAALQEANAAIAGIAQQTNMLAMNAAIEAAHAGDAGKGFSVVADEIRKLSETASEQSRSIGEELTKIIASMAEVVQISATSEETFNNLSTRIQETDTVVRQIRTAMEEQQIGSKQILSSLHNMNDCTNDVKSASVAMADGNKSILEEIKLLQETTDVIKNSMHEMTLGAKLINETGSQLHQISNKVSDSIKKIGSEVDLFKV